MKRTLVLLLTIISTSSFGQDIDHALDTTKSINNYSLGLRRSSMEIYSPLYILDDVEIKQEQLSAIKPDEIKSITILKDSAATAQYGDKAKLGVIIIESKKPRIKTPETRPEHKN